MARQAPIAPATGADIKIINNIVELEDLEAASSRLVGSLCRGLDTQTDK